MANSIDIFIDESGDFGPLDEQCPYYIVTMVFHHAEDVLFEHIQKLEFGLAMMGRADHCIHSSPAIRAEREYHNVPLAERRKIVSFMPALIRAGKLQWKCFFVPKKSGTNEAELIKALHAEIDPFLLANMSRMSAYSSVIVAYDKGQKQISRLITETFEAMLSNVQVTLTLPIQSRLFQVADYICTIKRMEYKVSKGATGLSKSESFFFDGVGQFKKNWLKPLAKYEWR